MEGDPATTPPGQAPLRPSDRHARIAALDIGRLGACLAVAFFHSDIDLGGQWWLASWGWVGVEFFMMLSGYVLSRPYLERAARRPFRPREYLTSRIARILPPYYVVVLVAAALTFFGHGSAATPVARPDLPWHVAAHLTFTHPFFTDTNRSLVSVLWSMGTEVHYYILFPLMLLLFRRRPLLALAIAAAVMLSTRLVLHFGFPEHAHLMGDLFLARGTEFAFGMALAALLGAGWSSARLLALAAALFAVGLTTAVLVPGIVTRELGVQGVIVLLFTALRLFGPLVAKSRLTRSLQFLGGASYSTYLVHTLAGKAALVALGAHRAALPLPLLSAVYVVAGQVVGVAFFLVVEKPLCRWAAHLLRVRSPVAVVPQIGGATS